MAGGMGTIEKKQAIPTVLAAQDAGINFVATAEGYLTNETMLGKALDGRRDRVVLATMLSGEPSRQHIRAAIENSLRRLRTDYVDLYQIHYLDPRWPIAGTMAELVKMKVEGKVRTFGGAHQLGDAGVGVAIGGLPDDALVLLDRLPVAGQAAVGVSGHDARLRRAPSRTLSASQSRRRVSSAAGADGASHSRGRSPLSCKGASRERGLRGLRPRILR
ncbi:aldo/keto reductase [Chloroflexota bacterium]